MSLRVGLTQEGVDCFVHFLAFAASNFASQFALEDICNDAGLFHYLLLRERGSVASYVVVVVALVIGILLDDFSGVVLDSKNIIVVVVVVNVINMIGFVV